LAILSDRMKKNLEELSRFTSTPGNGTTRLPFTPESQAAVEYLKREMSAAGMRVRVDAAGNVIGRVEGQRAGAPVLMIASHYDSVNNGGNFDGIAGVVAGIELVRHFRDEGIVLDHPIEVMGTNDEEGVRFGTGFFGVGAMAGDIDIEYLRSVRDMDGISLYDSMRSYGLDPESISLAARNIEEELAAFIEVHIEQGPILYNSGVEVGLVRGIVGIKRFIVTVNGRPDHAGTTPMDMRIDAMNCAAKVISRLSDWAVEADENSVATVGFFEVLPNAINIIPRQVKFSVDVRSINEASIMKISEQIRSELKSVCDRFGASFTIEETLNVSPVHLDETLLQTFERSCGKLGYSSTRMLSGAGHDSLPMAGKVKTAMLFVPSKDGRSHCQEEWTEYGDLVKAVQVLSDAFIDNGY